MERRNGFKEGQKREYSQDRAKNDPEFRGGRGVWEVEAVCTREAMRVMY